MKPTLLILAAGVGSRYGGLKQVDGMGPSGEAILDYSVYDALRAGFGKVVFVIRKDIEQDFRSIVGQRIERQIQTEYAFQEMDTALDWLPEKPNRQKPWGTGHAVLSAKDHLTEPFVAINADDFYGLDSFRAIASFCQNNCSPTEFGMVAYRLDNTLSENGAVSRGVCSVSPDGFLIEVTERTKIERLPTGIFYFDENNKKHRLAKHTPVSMNFWAMHPSVLPAVEHQFRDFVLQHMDQPKAEFYIPRIINTLLDAKKIKLRVLNSDSQWYGVTYTADKETVQQALTKLANTGVYPKPLW